MQNLECLITESPAAVQERLAFFIPHFAFYIFLGRCSGCRSVKPVSQKQTSEVTTGALPAPPTILDP
jgi:hypothetical protein